MKVMIVGAGIIGALAAYRLAMQGAEVTVIDAAQPATAASGASFGWINASFHANRDHFNLRLEAMAAHRRLAADLQSRAARWTGCLCWENQGDALDRQFDDLQMLGYRVRIIDSAAFRALEPAVQAPERALLFEEEAAVDLPVLARDALGAAMARGAQLVTGLRIDGVQTKAGRVTGLRWSGGTIPADRVLLAAGVATSPLLADIGVSLPMLKRPGLILRSAALPPLVSHVLVAPGQELRQDVSGCFLAPTAAAHQSDTTEEIEKNPQALADRAVARVAALLGRSLRWTSVTLAERPVPGDGLPVMGHCGPEGLYVATMHSGATLAPLAAEFAASEIMGQPFGNTEAALIAPYRPQRFTA